MPIARGAHSLPTEDLSVMIGTFSGFIAGHQCVLHTLANVMATAVDSAAVNIAEAVSHGWQTHDTGMANLMLLLRAQIYGL
jgi:FAD synthase